MKSKLLVLLAFVIGVGFGALLPALRFRIVTDGDRIVYRHDRLTGNIDIIDGKYFVRLEQGTPQEVALSKLSNEELFELLDRTTPPKK